MAPVPGHGRGSLWKQLFLCGKPAGDCDAEETSISSDEESDYEEAGRDPEVEDLVSMCSDASDDETAADEGDANLFGSLLSPKLEDLAPRPVKPSRSALPDLLDQLQVWPLLGAEARRAAVAVDHLQLDVVGLTKALLQSPTSAKLRGLGARTIGFNDPLEGIWLGGKHGQFVDNLEEVAFVEVDCRTFSSGHFSDRQARSSMAFARNVRALRELAGKIHQARAAGNVVYVHCAEGKNRGPAALIAYLLLHVPAVKSLESAFTRVRAVRQKARTDTNTFYQELLHICRSQGRTVKCCSRH